MNLEPGEILARFGEGTSCDLDRVGNAEPAEHALPRGLHSARCESRPVGELGHSQHVALELAAVVLENETSVVGHGRSRHEVAQAQVEGIEAKIARSDINEPL